VLVPTAPTGGGVAVVVGGAVMGVPVQAQLKLTPSPQSQVLVPTAPGAGGRLVSVGGGVMVPVQAQVMVPSGQAQVLVPTAPGA